MQIRTSWWLSDSSVISTLPLRLVDVLVLRESPLEPDE
jgi:hypothetical protein